MDTLQKLTILADAAKYDVACTSSGADKTPGPGGIGSAIAAGICHTFTADGRCVSLLKVLFSTPASMTANTASAAGQTTSPGQPLNRRNWPI